MVNAEIINAIAKSGIKKQFIAEKLDISMGSLNNKLAGRTNFTVTEAVELCRILGITEHDVAFYFCQNC